MADVSLSNGMRSNLLSLKGVTELFDRTQNRVNTGRKVTSAEDNPLSFFQSSSLRSRANGLERLLDGVGLGVKALEAADNGLKGIERLVESMQGLSRAALQSPASNARLGSATDRDYRPNALGAFPQVANITSITVRRRFLRGSRSLRAFQRRQRSPSRSLWRRPDRVTGDGTGRAAQSIANAINRAAGNLGPLVGGVTRPYVSASVDGGGRFFVENITGATDTPPSSSTLRVQVAGGV